MNYLFTKRFNFVDATAMTAAAVWFTQSKLGYAVAAWAVGMTISIIGQSRIKAK